jgi:uncharacterized protein YbdZ (MbtH family)
MTDIEPMYLIRQKQINALRLELPQPIIDDLCSNPVAHDPDGLVNYHKCIYKELRNGSEFCHYHDHAVPSLWEHDAAIAARAAATERERVRGGLLAWLEGHWTYTKVKRYGKWVDRSSIDYESTKQKIEFLLSNPGSKRDSESK